MKLCEHIVPMVRTENMERGRYGYWGPAFKLLAQHPEKAFVAFLTILEDGRYQYQLYNYPDPRRT